MHTSHNFYQIIAFYLLLCKSYNIIKGGFRKLAHKRENLLTLFLTTLYISAFTFGGGYVIVGFMKKHFVERLKWIENDEMLDLVALAQTSPGAIAVNAAILVGWRVGGFAGMLCAVLGTIIPPLVIISVISLFYAAFATNRYVALMLQGMRAGVAAIVLDVAAGMGKDIVLSKNILRIVMMAAGFLAAFVFDINAVLIILAGLAIGIITALIDARKERGK